MEHQTTKSKQIIKLLQIIPKNWLNKLVSTKRWNSHVEFHGKNDEPRKIWINLQFIWTELYELFDGKPC